MAGNAHDQLLNKITVQNGDLHAQIEVSGITSNNFIVKSCPSISILCHFKVLNAICGKFITKAARACCYFRPLNTHNSHKPLASCSRANVLCVKSDASEAIIGIIIAYDFRHAETPWADLTSHRLCYPRIHRWSSYSSYPSVRPATHRLKFRASLLTPSLCPAQRPRSWCFSTSTPTGVASATCWSPSGTKEPTWSPKNWTLPVSSWPKWTVIKKVRCGELRGPFVCSLSLHNRNTRFTFVTLLHLFTLFTLADSLRFVCALARALPSAAHFTMGALSIFCR